MSTHKTEGSFNMNGDKQEMRPTVAWVPGSFDLFHYGHASLIRQAKKETEKGDKNGKVVVGLYSDADLRRMEGEPVFTEEERFQILESIRWVDAVQRNASPGLDRKMIQDNACEFAFLGNKTADQKARSLIGKGWLKLGEKLKGISTSNIIHRILSIEDRDENNNSVSGKNWDSGDYSFKEGLGFSSREILQFSTGAVPKPTDKIVYVAGAFDILHPGHIKVLEYARKLGDFLYVGVHSDAVVRRYAGQKYPIMRADERVMTLLACKHVSEVIMDAPFAIDQALLTEFNVSVVLGLAFEFDGVKGLEDPYATAKKLGRFKRLKMLAEDLTTDKIVERVHSKWFEYEDRLASSSSSDFLARGQQKSLQNLQDLLDESPSA